MSNMTLSAFIISTEFRKAVNDCCGNTKDELKLALSAATQALTDMGARLKDGVWYRPVFNCKKCGLGDRCNCEHVITEWLPITRQSGGEGGAG